MLQMRVSASTQIPGQAELFVLHVDIRPRYKDLGTS